MKPIVVYDQPAEMYHAVSALSAGMATDILFKCPAEAWWRSPLNPERPPEKNPVFDVGTAAHLAILEPAILGERVVIVDAEDWRTKAAKDARDKAWIDGLSPLLLSDYRLVERMANRLRENDLVAELLDGAATEVSYYWTDGAVECKARADIVSADRRTLGDIKTAANASPAFFQRQAGNLAYDLRADWYMSGWRLCAQIGEQPAYKWIVIGKDEPHLVTVFELPEEDIETAHMLNRRAVEIFAECAQSGVWPGYGGDREMRVGLASWARMQRRAAVDAMDAPMGVADWTEGVY